MTLPASSTPIVGVYHEAPETILPILRQSVDAERLRVVSTADGLGPIADEIDVLLAFRCRGHSFPRDQILAARRLEWVQLSSAGIDHMLPFDPQRLTVTNTSGLHASSVAWYVLSGLAYLQWDLPGFKRQQEERTWRRRVVPSGRGRTMLVIGAGRVGSAVAAAARTLGMSTLGISRSGRSRPEFDAVSRIDRMHELIERADYVVVALPLTPATRGCLDDAALARLRPSAYVVNVSRGGIVDDEALGRRLREGAIAGAVLDVFASEPLPATSPLWSLPNALITPHVSGEFDGWPEAVARFFCDNLRRWVAGDALVNAVDAASGY